ncbi:hypothetical protein CCP4SC76_6720008 [Gammaproteobacteria bacterium]
MVSGCQCLWPYYPSGWAISTGGEVGGVSVLDRLARHWGAGSIPYRQTANHLPNTNPSQAYQCPRLPRKPLLVPPCPETFCT